MKIAVVGAGFVGLSIAAFFAAWARHEVVVIDIDTDKVSRLNLGVIPFEEPDLADAIKVGMVEGKLSFRSSLNTRVDLAFVCVGTPPATLDMFDGLHQDQDALVDAVSAVAHHTLDIVIKSTVQPGTCKALKRFVPAGTRIHHIPEFLAEGTALEDARKPSRVVIGRDGRAGEAPDALASFAAETYPLGTDIIWTSTTTAELAKYASNTALAMRVSFANDIASVARSLGGVDTGAVLEAVGLDPRIGPRFLRDGLGWGGSCFPKDLEVMARLGSRSAEWAIDVNRQAAHWWLKRIIRAVPDGPITILGASFKPGTSDTRNSPALVLAAEIEARRGSCRIHDPVVELPGVMNGDVYDACEGATAVVIATDWPEYGRLDLDQLRGVVLGPYFVDTRNMWRTRRHDVVNAGFTYLGG